ncbi:MAG: CHAT domain-containing protein, partial [Candidatus Eremiobacterota bacterium]
MYSYRELTIKISASEKDDEYEFEIIPPLLSEKKYISKLTKEEIEKYFVYNLLKDGKPRTVKMNITGRKLWNFIPEEIRTEIRELKKRGNLRLSLLIECKLQGLPWETLYDDSKIDNWIFKPSLLNDNGISIVHTGNKKYIDSFAPMETLKVLLVGSNAGSAEKNIENIVNGVVEFNMDLIEKQLNSIKVEVDILNINPDFESDFKNALKKGYHVIHFYGHGYIEGDKIVPEHSYIILNDRKHLSAKDLSEILPEETRLVFFSSCRTAMGFGYALNQAGIPAIIAMRYEISQKIAEEVIKTFYKRLSERWPVEEAFNEARNEIKTIEFIGRAHDTTEFFTPVLFLSAKNSRLFASPEDVDLGNYLKYLIAIYSNVSNIAGKEYSMDDVIPAKF